MSGTVYTQQYRNVKDWIGILPNSWQYARLKHCCTLVTDGSHFSPEVQVEGLPYVTVRDLNGGRIDISNASRISYEDFRALEKNGCRPRVGDVIFSKDGTIGKIAIVNDDGFVILSSLAMLRPRPEVDSIFLAYFLSSQIGLDQMKTYLAGAALRRITLDVIKDFVAILPPNNVQHAIAAFLDRETERIDTLIAKKERQIELLQEKRAALISHVVTKGLNPNVKMKDSGIEWLGKIPDHWTITRFKYALWLQRGHDLPATEFLEGVYPVCGSNGCIGYHDHFTTKGPGVTVGRSGSVGEVNYIDRDYWAHNTALYVKEFRRTRPKYAFYLLKALDVKYLSEGSAVGTLNRNYIHDLPVAVPVASEQDTIVSFLDRETARLDALIQRIKTSIEMLREYRTALISAAVTGKIDVPKEALY